MSSSQNCTRTVITEAEGKQSGFRQSEGPDFKGEVFLVAEAEGAVQDDADFVEALDETVGIFFRLAIGGDAIPVLADHAGELVVRGKISCPRNCCSQLSKNERASVRSA